MRGDDDRRPKPVKLDEQPQETSREARIDIAGRLVRQQQFRANDQRASDRRALLFAAGKDRRDAFIRSPRPTQRRSSTTSAR